MVQGMAFLSKKRFNPQNLSNQKAVWEARQEKANEAKRLKERQDQLRRERDDEELARARGGERGGDEAKLRFMYGAPPGFPAVEKKTAEDDLPFKQAEATTNDVTKRQPGDDDAAAAFRQMLAAASAPGESTMSADKKNGTNISDVISGAALSGTSVEAASKGNESLTALEKAVGRKDAGKSLTLEEQVARFPQLKNAPMAKGMSSTNVNVNFKPLGTQLRHIRCLACGVWGHSRGDRECELSGWNPFAVSSKPTAVKTNSQAGGTNERVDSPTKKRKDDSEDWDLISDRSSSDESTRRRRKKREKKHKSRRKHDSKRRRRSQSSSPDEDRRSRKKSHKKRRKHSSRHD